MTNREKIDQYLILMDECRNLGKDLNPIGLTNDELVATIKSNAELRFENMCKNKKILKELIFDKKADELTSEDIEDLKYFASKVFSYSLSKDNGVAYSIHKLLLEYAKEKNDEPFIIEELYNCGICLFYVNLSSKGYDAPTFRRKVIDYFTEAVDNYFSKYEQYDTKTRFYLLRCLGNRKLGLDTRFTEGVNQYLKIFEESLDIFTSKKYQEMNPDIPFENLTYSMCLDAPSLMHYVRKKKYEDYNELDMKVASIMYESMQYVNARKKKFVKEENRLQNWRIDYLVRATRYHYNKGPIMDVVEYLLNQIESADSKDSSPTTVRSIISNTPFMIEYANLLSKKEYELLEPRINAAKYKALNYVEVINERDYPSLINNVLSNYTLIQAMDFKTGTKHILNHIVYCHKPTYVHSLMVAILTRNLVTFTLESNPEYFIGVLNTSNVDEVLKNKGKICDFAYECGLYHDVGKTLVLSYISTYERGLIDEEFECVKNHTIFGSQTLESLNEHDLALAALYHHKTYDNKGGYPYDVEICPSYIKPIVDALSIADSLDAATDFIGRSYTMAKSLDTIYQELKNGAGTRYSPVIVNTLDNEENYQKIKFILNDERKSVYVSVYRNNKFE